MGSLGRAIPAHRLSHQQILGHTRTLCLALADVKIQCIEDESLAKLELKNQELIQKRERLVSVMTESEKE